METKEKNQMIADFMGERKYRLEAYVDSIYTLSKTIQNPCYHNSWDWLMPVIEKIGQDTGYTLVMEENTSYWVNQGDYGVDNAQFGGYCSIGNIYDAVVGFIEWWNKSQTNE